MTSPIRLPPMTSCLFICALLAALVYLTFGAERAAWNGAQKQGTVEAYHSFMTRFPRSRHFEAAAQRKADGIKAHLATALQYVQSESCDSATPLLETIIRVDPTNAYALNGAAYCSLDEPHSLVSLERALDYLNRAVSDVSNQFGAPGPPYARVVRGRAAVHAFVLLRPANEVSGPPLAPTIQRNICAVVDMLAVERFPSRVQIPTFCADVGGGR
jgi:hypothetical protein